MQKLKVSDVNKLCQHRMLTNGSKSIPDNETRNMAVFTMLFNSENKILENGILNEKVFVCIYTYIFKESSRINIYLSSNQEA